MSIPINGRIAILDDNLKQALPIIQELGKRQYPCTYYSGELKYLPEVKNKSNDIRVLFLDIYLTGDESRSDKEVKSTLVPVLSKLISDDNFPYVIIFWSRHKDEHKNLIKEIFEKDLPEKKPIDYLAVDKTKFFSNMGDQTPDFEKELNTLWEKILFTLNSVPVYSSLLEWENIIHFSADSTIKEVFSNIKGVDNWEDNANRFFHSLGISYSGKHFSEMDEIDKNKSSLFTLNHFFNDTLEHEIYSSSFFDIKIKESDVNIKMDAIYNLNSKLLIQKNSIIKDYPGTVLESSENDSDYFNNVFNNILDHTYLEQNIKKKNLGASGNKIKRECSKLRKKMRRNWKKIWVITTPLCDYAQRKVIYTNVVRGALIEAEFYEFLDQKSDSIFLSPTFEYDGKYYLLVMQFRNLFSIRGLSELENLSVLFRIRQNLIVEIQSKLSRHLNRQGVLFLDPNYV